MSRKKKTVDMSGTVEDMISHAQSDSEELRDELQNWLDNLPENLQGGSKADELESAISELEEGSDYISNTTVPERFASLKVPLQIPVGRKYTSRSWRLSFCQQYLDEAKGVIEGEVANIDSEIEEISEKRKEPTEADEKKIDELESLKDEAESICDELQSASDSWSGVSFPSMFG